MKALRVCITTSRNRSYVQSALETEKRASNSPGGS